jgi:hypothetical protein
MQIIEHLGQFDFWGYMSDILIQQAHCNNHLEMFAENRQIKFLELAKRRLRRAQPISGFIISEDENGSIACLLQSIFSTRIDTRTIEQILNGKKAY